MVLWVAFAANTALVFTIGEREEAMDFIPLFLLAGFLDAVLAGVLLWRHGLSLATPVIIAAYAFANKNLFFLLFLSVIFWPKAAP